ncbi:PaaI family thioesterase [Streptomyces sp. NPDC101776]|uniref:PaaI family thioesterase n=1 Tax=Streptomyces sp. NPDC101776 TaxID=3366146 RepID=UPI00380D8B5D
MHEGVICRAADGDLTLAPTTRSVRGSATAGLGVDFLRPARGDLLVARGVVLRATHRQAACRCEVYAMGLRPPSPSPAGRTAPTLWPRARCAPYANAASRGLPTARWSSSTTSRRPAVRRPGSPR